MSLVYVEPLSYRGKVTYRGFASPVRSEDDVNVVLEKVQRFVGSSRATMSYALRMTQEDSSDIIEFSDDNGEFGAGDLLINALVRADLENSMVVVTIEGRGCFSTDFVPVESVRLIQSAANSAADALISRQAEIEATELRTQESLTKELTESTVEPTKSQEFIRLVNEEDGTVTLVPMDRLYGKPRNMDNIPTFKPKVPLFANPEEVPLYQADELAEQAEMRRRRHLKVSLKPFK